MEDYKSMYYFLFNSITDVTEQLKVVQREAERMFMADDSNTSELFIEGE